MVETVVVGITFAVELLANKKMKKRVEGMMVGYNDIVHGCAVPHTRYTRAAVQRDKRFRYNLTTGIKTRGCTVG